MIINSRSDLLVCIVNEGLLPVIGDVIMSETYPLVLVCCLFAPYSFSAFFTFILKSKRCSLKKVTRMLSSTLVDEYGLEKKGQEELSQDMIGNILRMVFV